MASESGEASSVPQRARCPIRATACIDVGRRARTGCARITFSCRNDGAVRERDSAHDSRKDNRRSGRGFVIVATISLAAVAVGARLSDTPLDAARAIIVRALSSPIERVRAVGGPRLRVFTHLAATQLGYPISAPKAFTSHRPFASFEVLDHMTGRVVWSGGAPVRQVDTALLGEVTRVWIGDFTPLTAPGRYRIVADNGLTSHPFEVGTQVFDAAIRAVQRAFYFQRAFTAIPAQHAEGPWTHGNDAALAPAGIRGGWHDAGDFSLYNMTAASSLFWLLEAHRDFAPTADDTNIPESGNGVPDLLDEARWELEWLLSSEDGGGGFQNTTCVDAYGPYGSNPLERVGRYRRGEVGTIPTARAVGVLAYASIVFAEYDSRFAGTLRAAATRGWQYLEARRGEHSDGPTCPAFRQDGDAGAGRAARAFAAAGLLLATGSREFIDAFDATFDGLDGDPTAYSFSAYAALLYLRAPAADPARRAAIAARMGDLAQQARAHGLSHPFEWTGQYIWGSIASGFERVGAYAVKRCLADPRGGADHCRQALANIDYAFGRNSFQFAYVSGIPGVTRGRQHSFHHWLATLRATPFVFPGMVAGGPNEAPEATDGSRPLARPVSIWGYWGDPSMRRDASTPVDQRYTDNDSYSTNEIDINWQAPTLYVLYFGQWFARGAHPLAAAQIAANVPDNPLGGTPVAVGVPR